MQVDFNADNTIWALTPPLLSTDVNGSFDDCYSSDFVYATNVSGRDISNVILFVNIEGKHGADAGAASDGHMHYIENWPAGETGILRYRSTGASGFASNESVDQITRLQLRIYSDQFSQTENYIYTGRDFTEDVERYLDGIRFTASWSSYSDDHWFYNSGVTIKTTDVRSFPATHATVSVTSGSRTKSFRWSLSEDVFDGEQDFSRSDFNGQSVDRIDAKFDLPYTDIAVEGHWTFR